MIILIVGLPGSGKTTLATKLAKKYNAVHINADDIRNNVHKSLGFSIEDRLWQAKSMGHLCGLVDKTGGTVVCDFVCPTEAAREAFGSYDVMIFMDTIEEGRFVDTNKIFVPPTQADIVIDSFDYTIGI